MNILLTGATGLIGRELGKHLALKGHQIWIIARDPKSTHEKLPFPHISADWQGRGLPIDQTCDAVVHLAGEPIAEHRWTTEQKKKILSSRTETTEKLAQLLQTRANWVPKTWINASAVGYYGNRGDETLTEDSSAGEGFLSEVCQAWEQSLKNVPGLKQTRKAWVRTGVVLSPRGGAMTELLPVFRSGLGGAIGSGKQWMSWIHLDDIVGLYTWILENPQAEGTFNGTAPQPVTNQAFTAILGKCLEKPSFFKVPGLAMTATLGERAAVLLESQKVIPTRTVAEGFRFQFPELSEALQNLLGPSEIAASEYFHIATYLDHPITEVFDFFSRAENLSSITPDWLDFRIEKVSTNRIGQDTLIDYRLRIHGVPVQWRTRIDQWHPPNVFSDTQLKGPYSLWHHTHRFSTLGKGTLMEDTVRYRVPLGPLGKVTAGWKVKKDVAAIFAYRQKRIPELLKPAGRT